MPLYNSSEIFVPAKQYGNTIHSDFLDIKKTDRDALLCLCLLPITSSSEVSLFKRFISMFITGLPVRPVIKWAFGRLRRKTASRGREDTRVWYRETMFSHSWFHMSFSWMEPCTDTFCTLSALPLKNLQGVANLKKAICVVRSDSTMGVTRSPSNGASISIYFLSQPFPE